MMRLPASRNFVPSSDLHLQRIVHPGRNLNPRLEHLPACHDFGTEMSFSPQVEIVRQVCRTASSRGFHFTPTYDSTWRLDLS